MLRSAFRDLVRPNYRLYPIAGSQNDELIDIVHTLKALLGETEAKLYFPRRWFSAGCEEKHERRRCNRGGKDRRYRR
jgi:hypothetical protein